MTKPKGYVWADPEDLDKTIAALDAEYDTMVEKYLGDANALRDIAISRELQKAITKFVFVERPNTTEPELSRLLIDGLAKAFVQAILATVPIDKREAVSEIALRRFDRVARDLMKQVSSVEPAERDDGVLVRRAKAK